MDGQLITENYVLPKPVPGDRHPDIITVIIRPASLLFLCMRGVNSGLISSNFSPFNTCKISMYVSL